MATSSKITRRNLFVAGAVGVAGGVMPIHATQAALALQGPAGPTVNRFKLGAFEVTTIMDGAIQLDGPHPIFGQNVSAEEVQALAEENFLPQTRMEIGFTQTLVNTGKELVLFDCGNGARRRPNAGQMRARLAAAGVAPEAIDVVAITHFHGDHIGGLLEDGASAFPNARYVLGAAEYNFWANEDLLLDDKMVGRAQLVQDNVVVHAEKASFIKPGDSVVSGIDAVDSHGHTPGHLSYHIESEGKRLVVLGDVCNHYVVSMQRPDWHVRFDMDKDKAVAARKQMLGMIAADRIPFVGYHMPFPAVGWAEAMDEGFRFVPASYQFNV